MRIESTSRLISIQPPFVPIGEGILIWHASDGPSHLPGVGIVNVSVFVYAHQAIEVERFSRGVAHVADLAGQYARQLASRQGDTRRFGRQTKGVVPDVVFVLGPLAQVSFGSSQAIPILAQAR